MKRAFIIITLLIFTTVGSICVAQDKKDTLKVLFVGNSYTYFENLPQMVSAVSDYSSTKLITRQSTLGGAKLSEHWRGARGLKTKEIIEKGDFDIVVLQEYSMGAIDEPDSLKKYVALFCDFAGKNGARPYLYLTWARERVPQYQETINKVYAAAALENNAVIVPVGKAWALARQLRPDFELFSDDGSHPAKYGAFLSACVFVAVISGEVPEKLPNDYNTTDHDSEYIRLMSLESLNVTFCRQTAREVIQEK